MLGRRSREVDLQFVAVDRDRDPELKASLRRFEHVRSFVAAIRQTRDRGADPALRVRDQLVHGVGQSPAAVADKQLPDAPLSQPLRGPSAPAGRRGARPGSACARRGPPCVLVEAGGWNDDALLGERPRARGQMARFRAAHVGVVRAVGGERARSARRASRRVDGCAGIRVVEDPRLARRGRCRERGRHRGGMHRDGPGCVRPARPAARARRRPRREIAALLDVGRERRRRAPRPSPRRRREARLRSPAARCSTCAPGRGCRGRRSGQPSRQAPSRSRPRARPQPGRGRSVPCC